MCIRVRGISVRCARPPFLTPALGAVPGAVTLPVFAVSRMPGGRWSIVAPGCRDLSGRTGVRRIAMLEEPAAGGAKVIKLKEWAGVARRA